MVGKSPVTLRKLQDAGAKIVSLAQNPYDMRPAIDAVIEQICNLHPLRTMTPTIMMMGQHHKTSIHILMAAAILDELATHRPDELAAGLELAHNMPHLTLLECGHTDDDINMAMGGPNANKIALSLLLDNPCSTDAPQAHAQLHQVYFDQQLSTCFADSAHIGFSDFLDHDDPTVRHIAKQRSISLAQPIKSRQGPGMDIRNTHINDSLLGHMRYTGRKLGGIPIGAGHIAGIVGAYDHATSLARMFHDAGINFMSMIPMGRQMKPAYVPPESVPLFQNAIIVTDMNERCFTSASRDEGKYIEHVLHQSGMIPTPTRQR